MQRRDKSVLGGVRQKETEAMAWVGGGGSLAAVFMNADHAKGKRNNSAAVDFVIVNSRQRKRWKRGGERRRKRRRKVKWKQIGRRRK